MNVIESAQTDWASPIRSAQKKDGNLRFWIDYRKLNAVAIHDSYPLPRMDDCIDSFGDAQVYWTLSAIRGYWKIEVDPSDRRKTAFTFHHGLYQFIRMPFRLKNASATFSCIMDIILFSVRSQFAFFILKIESFIPKHCANKSTIPYLFTAIWRGLASLLGWKVYIFHNQDRVSWSPYTSSSTWSRQLHHWLYTRLKYTNDTKRTTLIYRFVKRILPVCP